MATSSINWPPTQSRDTHPGTLSKKTKEADTRGSSEVIALSLKMVRSTLRAEATEFKPRTSSLRANAPEFKPCRNRKFVKETHQKLARIAKSTPTLSLLHENKNGIDILINRDESSSGIIDRPLILSKAVPATEFHLFPNLPAELRFRIWNLSLPGPRMVVLHYNQLTSRAVSSTLAPVLFHTTRESRCEAMKQYMLTNVRSCIWKSLKYVAINLMPNLTVLSRFQSLLTYSVVLSSPNADHETNHRLVDIPWKGCTHTRDDTSESGHLETETTEHNAPCSVCKQIVHQVNNFRDEKG
ncbi:hypothetical protein ONS95_009439 [Cadophora gregata]|uniref:uncharacterized protein n=1 Tax=Cadophora gregata TaxID=51156 RepID=UPI0026DDA4A9|nr:uncharacterized protein ONS95_009439 [Cadophora gregata]KAK0124487.1 hypothetical protein ONS95_009439 [Cadophora gregata]KAK0129659.1 hypothetical protein ONS96_000222 [Cadophora gregata f. sp. sojae]